MLLDNLIKNTNFLNASLAFYSGDELDTFAKKASELAEPEKTIELILPLDKAAKTLNSHELKALYKDGFFIRKKAAEQSPDVIRSRQLKGMFQVVKSPGKYKMLRHDGSVGEELIFQKQETGISDAYSCCCDCYEQRSKADPGVTAAKYMHQNENTGDFITVDG